MIRTFITILFLSLPSMEASLSFAQSNEIVACWGRETEGQCATPNGLGPCSQVAAGKLHSVALEVNGSIHCWGSNAYQQCVAPPITVSYSYVAAGWYHTLAVTSNGFVKAWGRNDSGQCNISPTMGTCTQISGGAAHSLALRSNGDVLGWGNNEFGQISVPTSLGSCIAVAAGGYHSAALTTQGTVVCWGRDQCAITGSTKIIEFLRDVQNGTDSVDFLQCGDSNTGFRDSQDVSGWTDGFANALRARGFPQYATPLLPIEPPGRSFGVSSENGVMPFGNGSTRGSSIAFNMSGLANAPSELVTQLTSGVAPNEIGLQPTAVPFDFAWIPLQQNRFSNFDSGVYVKTDSALDIKSELVYRIVRGELPQSNNPGSYFQGWRNELQQNLVLPTPRSVMGNSFGWVADELVLPADENRAMSSLHATCCGTGFGQSFGIEGNCAMGLQSVYKRRRGWASQPLEYRGGATMTRIATDISQMPLESRMTWLKELASRQIAGGGSGRIIVLIQGGINQDVNVPNSWGNAVVSIKNALESAWSALGNNPNNITFVAMVSHPIYDPENMLVHLREYANNLPNTVSNLTIIDLSKLSTTNEMSSKIWYSSGSQYHLSDLGYSKFSERILDDLFGQLSPISTPLDCQQIGSCIRIATGAHHTLALKSDGSIRSWGSPIGGSWAIPNSPGPYIEIAAGDTHSLAINSMKKIFLWGSCQQYQCGVPANINSGTRVACGGFHNVVLAELQDYLCRSDLNRDRTTDGIDLVQALAGWGKAAGDCNDDGTTDGIDLLFILAGWGPCP